MLHRKPFRWAVLPLLAGALLIGGRPAQADIVIYNGNLSIGVGSLNRHPFDRHPFDRSPRRPTQIFTNRIENSTLINPVVIGVPIENSTLINPVIVPSSRRTVVIDRDSRFDRRTTTIVPYLGSPSGSPGCTYFVSQRPACW